VLFSPKQKRTIKKFEDFGPFFQKYRRFNILLRAISGQLQIARNPANNQSWLTV